MLNVSKISKSFGEKAAVTNVSFAVEPGQIFALIGPNGAGKTTIVKLIAGLLHPTSGSVDIEGQDVVKAPLAAKSLIGYIPDEPVVWSGMTGEEFLHFVGALYGVPPAERAARIAELLRFFDLSGLEKDFFEDYSRGNKQKFVILSALLHRPKLLLVDEPIVGLDPTSADIAKNIFAEFANHGNMVVLVTHTLTVAEAIATHIGVLAGGLLKAAGTLDELRTRTKTGPTGSLEAIYHALT
ncbi:MAG TPA: ABC transporter ATP-binding protein [Candidatus Paceibacterota bacterium]|nr:ABC transporter ATP-binding protein [Candidatus Paceibacterota bacterium]